MEDKIYMKEYQKWLEKVEGADMKRLEKMPEDEIRESFYRSLEFGTGGLRGIMGLGTNRMNVYTVKQATQGLANEILDLGGDAKEKGVVIAYDSRNNSDVFAFEAASVLCGNGIKTYLFDGLRPTPMLSFAVRYLGCVRGIVITASHNPKEYNGYKVYGEDGGQIPPSVAEKIIGYINRTDIFDDVKASGKPSFVSIGSEVDDAYIAAVKEQSMGVEIPDGFKVIYTPIHGSGNKPVRRILDEIGAKNVFTVPEQEMPNGDFSTVKSPNPENMEAFDLAIEYAKKQGADIILGTDPDSDRIGVVVRANDGEYKVLNGNQTGMLICEFILRKMKERGELTAAHTVVKTIVTTEEIRKIADSYGVQVIDVLTGFKFIGEKIKEFEKSGERKFVFGLEESYGYLKGTYARDKDAVVAAMLIVEMAADLKKSGKTLYDGLIDIYERYGYMTESLKTLTLEGAEGAAKIEAAMEKLRNSPPREIAGHKVTEVKDYLGGIDGLPKSDVLKFFLDDGWCAVRPSGTEPKIKLYFGLNGKDKTAADKMFDELNAEMFG